MNNRVIAAGKQKFNLYRKISQLFRFPTSAAQNPA
jgi:hypothetical protein